MRLMSDVVRCSMRCGVRRGAMLQIPANPHGQHQRRESKPGSRASPAFMIIYPRTLGTLLRGPNNAFSITVPSIFSGYPPHILMTVPLYFTANRDRPLDLPRPPWHLVTLSHTYTLESTLPPKTRDSTYHNKMIYDYDVARTAEVGAAVRQTPSTHPLGIL